MTSIKIHPFNPIDPVLLADLEKAIQAHFRIDTVLGEDISLPAHSLSNPRKQFLARPFLRKLSLLDRNDPAIHLGITDVDLYAPGLNFVFGQADSQSRSAVFSLARLDPRSYGDPENYPLFLRRALKEAVHELGHVMGLNHCENQSCAMWFSNSLAETDLKGTDFCPKCARQFYARFQKAA